MKITVETYVRAPLDTVWRAWTTPDDIIRWNAASDDWHTTAATNPMELQRQGWQAILDSFARYVEAGR